MPVFNVRFLADAAASTKGLSNRRNKRLVYVSSAIQESPIRAVLLFKI